MFSISSILTSMLHKFDVLILSYIVTILYKFNIGGRIFHRLYRVLFFENFKIFLLFFFSFLLLIDQMKVSSLEVGFTKMQVVSRDAERGGRGLSSRKKATSHISASFYKLLLFIFLNQFFFIIVLLLLLVVVFCQ